MDFYRLRHTLGMYLTSTAVKRAEYLRKHDILYHIGGNCMTMFRKIPLYPKLISLGDNVWIASEVVFINHDVIHKMVNNMDKSGKWTEYVGCIEIKDNCFIGSCTTILPNVSIGPNTIVGAGSVVNKNLTGGVYAGVPARYVCSLEDFLKKRGNYPDVKLERSKGRLSEKTVEACWNRFRCGQEENGI